MPLTWQADQNKITLTFQAEIYNNQTLEHIYDRIGPGFTLCIYKVIEDDKIQRKNLELITRVHDLSLPLPWNEESYPDHITTLVLLHNPSSDSDSMATSDAPTIPL
jgi:hypothetical protein